VAKASDPHAGTKDADKAGLLSGLLAEENEFDRRSLWRIGTWGVAAVGAVVLAVAANQSSLGWRRDQVAAADLARQAQQIQSLARESQNETRRLVSAIDTLNSDRDRLFARVTVVEQGLDSVTGAISKQAANSASVASAPPKLMPPASAMPSMIAAPPVVAADNAGPSVPLPQSQAAPVANAGAIPPEKPKEAKTEPAKTEQAKPVAADAAPLPQIASSKPNTLAPAANPPAPASAVAAQSPSPAMGTTKSMMGPPDPGAPRMIETSKDQTKTAANAVPTTAAAPPPDANATATPAKDEEKPELDADAANDADKSTIQRTEFAVELGGANSISGLRALWHGLLKSHDNKTALASLQPIMVLRESNIGLGMQLKLAAGPLHDAAEAAKICAALTESSKRTCETTVFDGQRLAMGADEAQPAPVTKPQPATEAGGKSTSYKRYKHGSKKDDPAAPAPKESSTFSSLLGLGKR
jgi:hypothetical protein